VSYPLSQAQIRFQRIKRRERRAHIDQAKQDLRNEFEMRREAIESAIVARLEASGQVVNATVVRNLATQQAVKERQDARWERKDSGQC